MKTTTVAEFQSMTDTDPDEIQTANPFAGLRIDVQPDDEWGMAMHKVRTALLDAGRVASEEQIRAETSRLWGPAADTTTATIARNGKVDFVDMDSPEGQAIVEGVVRSAMGLPAEPKAARCEGKLMGATRKRGPAASRQEASVPAQPKPQPLCDMIVTVGLAFTRNADGFGVDVFVGTDGERVLTDAVMACEAAGDLRGPVGELITAIAKALGGERVPGKSSWLGAGSVWGDDGKRIGRA